MALDPRAWLDATYAASLYLDANGSTPTKAGGRVRQWKDCAGRSLGYQFLMDAVATIDLNGINNQSVLQISGGPGTPTNNAFLSAVNSTGWTLVVVWRALFVAGTMGGGHPVNVGGQATFASHTWVDSVGVKDRRVMPDPSGAPIAPSDRRTEARGRFL